MRTIGVLAVQGAFSLHRPHIEAAGAAYLEVRSAAALARADALILPGGESAVMLRLLDHLGLDLAAFLKERPAWGICAGAILLARAVRNPEQRSFAIVDAELTRNAYGRQRESCELQVEKYAVSLIRAPKITAVGAAARVLAVHDGAPIWVEQKHTMLTTFHPETNPAAPSPWHRRLLSFGEQTHQSLS